MQSHIAAQVLSASQHLKQHGYAIIKNFISPQTCQQAINQLDTLVDNFSPSPENITIFDTGSSSHRLSKYFIDSGDKASLFFEPKAWENGQLTVPKRMSINKIAHALHEHSKVFDEITATSGVHELCGHVGMSDPIVMQSMAILKPPQIGGKVNIHQDSTFLYAEPDTLLGFWTPLQDATLNNGCLWGIPGSHKYPLYRRSKLINREPVDEQSYQVDYKEEDFVPLEMEKGSLAIFTGRFLHKSNENLSSQSRYAYTWHVMDRSSEWCRDNWLQRTAFPQLKRSL